MAIAWYASFLFALPTMRSSMFTHISHTIQRNFKQKVLAAYEWLSENFQQGDRIYILGSFYAP
jgi:uncharacterized protein (DUF2235 family)